MLAHKSIKQFHTITNLVMKSSYHAFAVKRACPQYTPKYHTFSKIFLFKVLILLDILFYLDRSSRQ